MKKFTFIIFILPFILVSPLIFAQNGDEIFVEDIGGIEYIVHKFTATGSNTFTPPGGITQVDVLVVGGGGGGIANTSFENAGGPGGGAGGYVYNENFSIGASAPVNLSVGAGGLRANFIGVGNNGDASSFGTITALGGGGAAMNGQNGVNQAGDGGSGGGGRENNTFGDGLQPSQSFPSTGLGNRGGDTPNAAIGAGGAGGGGAGSAGLDGGGGGNGFGGNGGSGVQNNMDGTNRFYAAGGGGGGSQSNPLGLGGSGIGGNGANATNASTSGAPNTGSGGGGGNDTDGAAGQAGDGGSGIVIVRYRLDQVTDFVFVNDGDYDVNTNWLNDLFPTAGSNVTIAASPNLLTNQTVNNITVFSGVEVDVANGISLNIVDNLNHLGSFIGEGEVVINGTSAQTLSGGGSFENLRLNKSTSLDFTDPTDLFGVVYVDQGTLNTNGNLSLGCDFVTGKTAQVGPVGGVIVGNVTVEQCYPARRAFRLISPSVTTSTSIRENWQENPLGYQDDPRPGYGTHITGVSPGSADAIVGQDGDDGFDYSPSGNASMFTFNNATPSWDRIGNTNGGLTAGEAYRLFLRGDRSINITLNGSPPSNTRLSATGVLAAGTQTEINLSNTAGAFNLIGNPYQAQVDMNSLVTGSSNISGLEYYVWDPTLGGIPAPGSPGGRGAYVAVDLGTGNNTSSSSANEFLQPMQAFFVRTGTDATASVTFQEAMKAVNQTQTVVKSNSVQEYINIQLFNAEAFSQGSTPSDGLRINFDKSFSISTEDDSPKLGNLDENLARVEGNVFSAIERRPLPEATEELPLFINQYRRESYVMKFDVTDNLNTEVFIKDKYLDQVTEITSSDNTYSFVIDSSIPESEASDRFSLVFEPVSLSIGDENLVNLSLYPNPTKGNFSISGIDSGQDTEVKIYNLIGQQVYTAKLSGQSTIEVADFNGTTGVYLVKLKTNQGEKTFKLIKD
ncbi:T9SS type A sorting domain-containing protein [Psychroflexus gondwanensis]|uniref:T9SS type A sorting domain-containing protein n=1 Tax=Psychroflexus gondwanensis TaxID=251 RepID=UPI001CC1F589|nr:T9SS type A sorting domain-containing protein [Psychroflexus gondwanensis]